MQTISLAILVASMCALGVAVALIVPMLRSFSTTRLVASLLCPASQLMTALFTFEMVWRNNLHESLALGIAGCTLICAALDVAFFRALATAEEADALAEEAATVEEQLRSQEGYAHTLAEAARSADALRTELARAFEGVADALDAGDAAAALEFLGRGEGAIEGTARVTSANPVAGALLTVKRARCVELGVAWDCRCELPESMGLPNVELCMLLSNLLDNAINAASADGVDGAFVQVWARVRQGCLAVTVANSYDPASQGRTLSDAGSGLVPRHGWGRRILASIVQAHDGDIQVSEKNGVWRTDVVLPLDDPDDPADPDDPGDSDDPAGTSSQA